MIFIDTGAFLAKFLAKDQFHSRCLEIWDELSFSKNKLFTSNFIIDETLTLISRRAGYQFAVDKAFTFYSSKILTILRPNLNDEIRALHFFTKFAPLRVSFTDSISFALMENYSLQKVFSFDKHFEIAGFEVIK